MREILFRGKRIDNGEWVFGCYICRHGRYGIITKNIIGVFDYQVIPETVGQFTNFEYSEGDKIFDGDLLHCIGGTFEVYFDTKEGAWVVKNEDNSMVYFLSEVYEDFELNGNIHDNEK